MELMDLTVKTTLRLPGVDGKDELANIRTEKITGYV
jgi:hypothetical protein